ncbi:hypothetical protein, partial [Shewanella sp. GXUN23E]|uniref:hypothetical protein n=1 Tax=Shewanella sp. GXUN23E TaxID=3422498 RepID=UPI003D7EA5D6
MLYNKHHTPIDIASLYCLSYRIKQAQDYTANQQPRQQTKSVNPLKTDIGSNSRKRIGDLNRFDESQ